MDRLLTIDEVAALTRVSPHTVRYWRKTGHGPHSFRLGRRVVFAEADVQAWLLRRRDADRKVVA